MVEEAYRVPSQRWSSQHALLGATVVSYVKELVLSGQASTGDPIGIEGLARQLGVSTTPVREALHALRAEGFLYFEPRRGFRFAPLARSDIADVYWMQAELAGELAARACRRFTAVDLSELEGHQERVQAAHTAGLVDEVERANFAFHRAINHAANAPKLAWMLGLVVQYAPRRFFSTIDGWPAASMDDHQAVIQAFRLGDAADARRAMTSHIQHAGELLARNLERIQRTARTASKSPSPDPFGIDLSSHVDQLGSTP